MYYRGMYMSYELDRLCRKKDEVFAEINSRLENTDIEQQLSQVKAEYDRQVQFSGQAGLVLNRIDREFQQKTKLNSTDTILLFLCTALQCVRQYLLTNEKFRFQPEKDAVGKTKISSSQKGDAFMNDLLGGIVKPEWKDVLFNSVPYDAISTGAHVSNTEIAGTTHRYRTLGHDPLLGWIFGTANIMTNSLTKYNFETFQVKNMTIVRHYPLGVIGMLGRASHYAIEDPKLLLASVARQAIHFGSDMFTTQGLPLPLIMTVNNDLAKDMLSKWHIDTWAVVCGGSMATFVNQLIACIHQLFYNANRDGTPSQYQVRTRKILNYSNLIATTSNIIVSVVSETAALLDVGGMLVTLYRLVSDYRFINDVKREFLEKEFYKQVVGESYDFMKEEKDV